MHLRRLWVLIAVVLAFAAPAMRAHHSEAAEYDSSKPVKLTGALTKVEWSNPHVWFYIDAKDDDGKITNWGFSTAPPGSLMRRGITKDALKIGSVVNVEGVRARDGSNNASMRRLTFPDGTQVLAPVEGR